MEVLVGVFILVLINQLINVVVLHQVVKDRDTLDSFVKAAKIYANAFEHVGIKQNDLISMVNKHSEILTVLTDLLPESLDQARAALEARQSGENPARVSKDHPENSTDTD